MTNKLILIILDGFDYRSVVAGSGFLELCAATIVDADLPEYANSLSLERFSDRKLMADLRAANRGLL